MADDRPLIEMADLSDEAGFALAFHLAERAEKALAVGGLAPVDEVKHLQLLKDFYDTMRAVWGFQTRQDVQHGKRFWLDSYLKGIGELAELGVVELKRNGEGSYDVVNLRDERIAPPIIIMARKPS